MSMIYKADEATPADPRTSGSPPEGGTRPDGGLIDEVWGGLKKVGKTATQLPGAILDKGTAILKDAGETLGGIVEAVIPDNPEQVGALVDAYGKLDRILNPEKYQTRSDTAAQGDVMVRVDSGGGTGSGGSSPLKADAARGAGKPTNTNWGMIGLATLAAGGLLVWWMRR